MLKKILFFITLLLSVVVVQAQRQVEKLNRGIVVMRDGDNSAYIGWRLLALENWEAGFNVYKKEGNGVQTLLTKTPITNSTNYRDPSVNHSVDNTYTIKKIENGVEEEKGESYTLKANTPKRRYQYIELKDYKASTPYDLIHAYVGDVDGDGDFDYLIKRVPQDASHNSIKLDCYTNEGKWLWTLDFGMNQETYINTMTCPVLVADFNGDGRAEIICRTYEGTVFGDGSRIGDTNGDGKTDYSCHCNNGNGWNVSEGPEFISLIDGLTGKELDRNQFISRSRHTMDKGSNGWGDNYGARVNFIMSSVCSFDGQKPGALFSRGEGARMEVEAWDVINNKLHKIWGWNSFGKSFKVGGWTDFHQIQCIDVDGDGKDETSWGCCMMNPNGQVRYTTKYVHGDRLIMTDINPDRPGLEAFIVQQKHPNLIGSALYDAATGNTIKDWMLGSIEDVGRGDVADLDPNSPGLEMFDSSNGMIRDARGNDFCSKNGMFPAVSIWWDGDLLREKLFGAGGPAQNPYLSKWNYNTKQEDRIFNVYNDDGNYSCSQPYAGRNALIADIMGDWREEFIVETNDKKGMRIYTTTDVTDHRVYTLMQNPAYRNNASTKGYLCSHYPDFYLGAGMKTPPVPNIVEVGTEGIVRTAELSAKQDKKSVVLTWKYVNIDPSKNAVYIGRSETDDPATMQRVDLIADYGDHTYTDATVEYGKTYYYWLKITADAYLSSMAKVTVINTEETKLTKCGAGSSSQAIEQGEPISEFCYTWQNATSVAIDGLPNGIVFAIDEVNKKVTISGVATDEPGEYQFVVKAIGGTSDVESKGTIKILGDPTLNESIVCHDKNKVQVYPTITDMDVVIDINADDDEVAQIMIIDMGGNVMFNSFFNLQYGVNKQIINLLSLNKGIYTIIVGTDNGFSHHKIVRK